MKSFPNIFLIIKAYLPPIIWAGLIFFLSNQETLPGASYPFLDYVFKQGAHIFVYGVLHFLIWRGVKLNYPDQKVTWLPLIIAFIYALSDEFHQSFIPGREATWIDIGFDSLGIAISHYLTHR